MRDKEELENLYRNYESEMQPDLETEEYSRLRRKIIEETDELEKELTEEQVKKETARCLGCGASVVDTNKCIGCGVCTTKCEFDAIKLHREIPEASTMRRCEDKMKGILPYAAKRGIKILMNKKGK